MGSRPQAISPDVVLLPNDESSDRWIAYNLFSRTAVGLDGKSLAYLGRSSSEDRDDEVLTVWDIEWFANEEGTLADPTCFRRNLSDWSEPLSLSPEAFLNFLTKHFIIVPDDAAYRERFARKRSPLDRQSFGNFHDRVGANLLFRRKSPSDWWLWQKFTSDFKHVRSNNLYGAVQWNYLKEYFPKTILPGQRVLDVGCGTGIYSKLMADCGGVVTGIDPNKEYLDIARANFQGGKTNFLELPIGQPEGLSAIPDESADIVFMSDALLFYFVKVSQKDSQQLSVLLADIRRILSPKGVFISVEPHPCFYLAPWLGRINHPFTSLTEYRNRKFSTVPTLADTLQALTTGGFLLRWMDELYCKNASEEVSPRAVGFAQEFPLWTLFEMIKNPVSHDPKS